MGFLPTNLSKSLGSIPKAGRFQVISLAFKVVFAFISFAATRLLRAFLRDVFSEFNGDLREDPIISNTGSCYP